MLAELKADPVRVGLDTLLREVEKLGRVRAVGLPDGLFEGASEKLVEAWRARAARSYPSDFRGSPRPVRLTLLAALVWSRASEITDSLVDLLIAVVHKMDVRAENRVEGELLKDLKKVRGKQGILFSLAEAAVDNPDETVRRALYPVVGERVRSKTWLGRPGRARRRSAGGFARCCAPPTPPTTVRCSRRSWPPSRSAPTTPPTAR